MEKKNTPTIQSKVKDDDDFSDSSSSEDLPKRREGKEKNFKLSEDQFLAKLIGEHFKEGGPTTDSDYHKIATIFNSDRYAKKNGFDLPYIRTENSIKRRIKRNITKTEAMIPPSGSSKPSMMHKVYGRLSNDSEVIESLETNEVTEKRGASKLEKEDKAEQTIDRPNKKARYNQFWDHPRAVQLSQSLNPPGKSDAELYFENVKALEHLKSLDAIDEPTYINRVKELAMKFGIL